MALIGVIGDSGSYVNRKLLLYASKNTPSLVIDCANAANPHSLFPEVSAEKMGDIYVVELEMLYKFRDVMLKVPFFIRDLKARCVIVTTSDHLFNYQDEVENNNIIEHTWELMKQIGKANTVVVGIEDGSVHEPFAERYCDKRWDIRF